MALSIVSGWVSAAACGSEVTQGGGSIRAGCSAGSALRGADACGATVDVVVLSSGNQRDASAGFTGGGSGAAICGGKAAGACSLVAGQRLAASGGTAGVLSLEASSSGDEATDALRN